MKTGIIATSSHLTPFKPDRKNPWDVDAVTHLLRRSSFGHTKAEVAQCLELGPRASVRRLLEGSAAGAEEKRLIAARQTVIASENSETLAAWWWMQLMITKHPLRARMSLFWHDHFATGSKKVRSTFFMAQQLASFERHGLGSFPKLLHEIAKGPAMLRFLDNESNRKGQANENFARELMELFTLGRGKYSEKDIKEAARAFTGWRISREAFSFDRRNHDKGEKTVLGRTGRFAGEDILDLVLKRKDCARFISAKLLASFVGKDHPKGAVSELAAVFEKTGGNIARCLEALLGSELFFRKEYRHARIRGPVEWILWFTRSLEMTASPTEMHRLSSRMGQRLLDPPDVAGWDEEEAWISSANWLHRANLAGSVGRDDVASALRPALSQRVPRAGGAGELDFLIERLFPEGLAEEELVVLQTQAHEEQSLDRALRLSGLLRTCLMLPSAHRF